MEKLEIKKIVEGLTESEKKLLLAKANYEMRKLEVEQLQADHEGMKSLLDSMTVDDLKTARGIIYGSRSKRKITAEQQAKMQAARKLKIDTKKMDWENRTDQK